MKNKLTWHKWSVKTVEYGYWRGKLFAKIHVLMNDLVAVSTRQRHAVFGTKKEAKAWANRRLPGAYD